ncbi:MAG: hypothetical protein Q9227_004401 [Pyrenula ochraceoflavens]
MSKLITVFGATGNQGGSVIRAVLSHPKLSSSFKIRGVTRDPSKPNAQLLTQHGVECVKADLNDPSSLEAAIKGSYAVYAVTNFWETMSKTTEVQQGKNIADACLRHDIKHLIWSSLPHVINLTSGVLKHVDHFDGKAEVEQYIESIKGDKMIATYFMPAFFMSNIKDMTRPGPDGVPTLSMPWDPTKTQVSMIDVASDTGKYVAGALAIGLTSPEKVDKLHLHGVSQWITPQQLVDDITKVTGQETKFNPISAETYRSFLPEQIASEMMETMVLIRDYSYYGNTAKGEQDKSDFVLDGQKLTDWPSFVKFSWVEGAKSSLPW